MQMSEEEVDVEVDDTTIRPNATQDEEVNVEDEEELSEKEDELEEEEQEGSDIDELSPPPSDMVEEEPAIQPRLKIKLKLGKVKGGISADTAASTPGPSASVSRTTSRRAPSRDIDIESEEPESEEDVVSTRSTSVATTATPGRALTARQAALANVVETSHVSLAEPPNPRKKKPLTDIEIALKREETARKRKNLSEKKLQDEKAETINRLLKKQSRAKGRRNALATAEDKPPTPLAAVTNALDLEAEEGVEGSETPALVLPTMYRWVSKVKTETNGDGESTKQMALSFSVPAAVLPQSRSTGIGMDVDTETARPELKQVQPLCNAPGCTVPRKYRLVKDWQRGACGMPHLKLLESQMATVT
ncbi:unnamed protein product [Somion occarium]